MGDKRWRYRKQPKFALSAIQTMTSGCKSRPGERFKIPHRLIADDGRLCRHRVRCRPSQRRAVPHPQQGGGAFHRAGRHARHRGWRQEMGRAPPARALPSRRACLMPGVIRRRPLCTCWWFFFFSPGQIDGLFKAAAGVGGRRQDHGHCGSLRHTADRTAAAGDPCVRSIRCGNNTRLFSGSISHSTNDFSIRRFGGARNRHRQQPRQKENRIMEMHWRGSLYEIHGISLERRRRRSRLVARLLVTSNF